VNMRLLYCGKIASAVSVEIRKLEVCMTITAQEVTRMCVTLHSVNLIRD
jgi:hypothetical protein